MAEEKPSKEPLYLNGWMLELVDQENGHLDFEGQAFKYNPFSRIARIKLYGQSIEIILLATPIRNGKILRYVVPFGERVITEVLDKSTIKVTIKHIGLSFTISFSDKSSASTLVTYFDSFENNMQEEIVFGIPTERQEFDEKVINTVWKSKDNQYINQICNNFFASISADFFCDCELISGFEWILCPFAEIKMTFANYRPKSLFLTLSRH